MLEASQVRIFAFPTVILFILPFGANNKKAALLRGKSLLIGRLPVSVVRKAPRKLKVAERQSRRIFRCDGTP